MANNPIELKNASGVTIYPKTYSDIVFRENGDNVDQALAKILAKLGGFTFLHVTEVDYDKLLADGVISDKVIYLIEPTEPLE